MEEKRWHSVWDPRVPEVYEPEKSMPEYIRDHAREMPGKIALSFYGYDMSYRELDDAVSRFAGGLIRLGVRNGDRVALFMQNCPQFVISYFGILRAGCVVVSLNPMFKQAELEYELNDSGTETLVTMDLLYPEIKKTGDRIRLNNIIVTSLRDYLPEKPVYSLPPEMEQPKVTFSNTLDFLQFLSGSPAEPVHRVDNLKDNVALLQYTGGTTGLPKGAVHTHYSLAHAAGTSRLWFNCNSDDVHMGVTPFFHIMGMLQCMCVAMATGGLLVILSRFLPEAVAEAINKYKCTFWITNTTAIIALLEWPRISRYDLGSLRIVWYGGASMPDAVLDRLRQLVPGAVFGEGYGLTETLSQGGVNTPLSRRKQGFIGIPNISVDLRIMDLKTGMKELGPGEEGEIIIKGPTVMAGYWNKPEETRDVLRGGWLYTGDIGRMDEEGYVGVVGRKKELIKCSGYSVFPSEVEGILHRHPAVSEVSVIGIPDPYRGETPKAFIVLRPEYKGKIREQYIVDWAKEEMAAYKRPRTVEFRDELPKTATGKVLRRVLAEEERVKM
ncbi:MAG: AMP-binding protein [Deltaproteobacteria bacterium]|nr:AMP-binding protein [Deltaproteobacteria bacterium]